MRNVDRIDAVVTDNPFRCSGCRANVNPQLCVRMVNMRPDHPPEVESVDLLLCESCGEAIGTAMTAARHDYEEAKDAALYRERHGTDDLKAILWAPFIDVPSWPPLPRKKP